MTRSPLIVAIDGPAGAGKSTVARRLAERLGYLLLDTGALYRTVALAARRAGADWSDEPTVAALARQLVIREAIQLERAPRALAAHEGGSGVRVVLDGADVSEAVRTPEISQGASQISALPAVRKALLDLQRRLGAAGGVVVEGRDIGTVVFPAAPVKFFLTASLEERARRRFDELRRSGAEADYEQTVREVAQRDRADAGRAVAPLRQAEDALLVDSSGRSVDDIIDEMAKVVATREGPS